jgi:hypothetical protein
MAKVCNEIDETTRIGTWPQNNSVYNEIPYWQDLVDCVEYRCLNKEIACHYTIVQQLTA